MIDIDYLRKNNLIIYECISGSRAYGLDLPHSDTDIKGIFLLSEDDFYGLGYVEQVNNESNDIVFYELKRFIELLLKNNPNLLDLLNVPPDCVLYKHPLMDHISSEMFLSKLCRYTFAEYAMAQIKKAKGLNKKISNPVKKEKKSILDFCYVVEEPGSVPLQDWLDKHAYLQEHCGLVKIGHMKDMYCIYYDASSSLKFKGIMHKDNSNDVSTSSVPKGMKASGIMSFNRDGYSVYCREYREYWEWVEKRNDERFANTVSHGKNYDAKNMMHVFRLLDMAEEIAKSKQVITRRPNREFLLSIRRGEFMYEDLVKQAEEKIQKVNELYELSDLPEVPDRIEAEKLLVRMRKEFYLLNS
ncbi:MAG: DNA polymerase beta superfamily protein [Cytophagaceae bacterium]